MKDEIKEILDNIKIVIDEGHYRATCDIDYEDCKILYDYITNLQEENKGLHTRIKTIKRRRKAQTAKMRKYREEITKKQNSIENYKSRNEKAIEYINKCTEKEINYITYKGKEYVVCGSDFNEGAEIILDILQGEDKDE